MPNPAPKMKPNGSNCDHHGQCQNVKSLMAAGDAGVRRYCTLNNIDTMRIGAVYQAERDLNALVKRNTAWRTFGEVVADVLQSKNGYWPTCRMDHPETAQFADIFDAAMEAAGCGKRAYRSGA
jgi:hypothetical protein